MDRPASWTPPRLSFGAISLRPDDRLPLGVENQITAGANFKAVPARLIAVEEECLSDVVFMRTRLDRHVRVAQDVRRTENVLAAIHHVREVVQSPSRAAE